MYVVSVGELKMDFTDHQPQSLIANAKKTEESHGAKVDQDKYEFFDLPGARKSARVMFCVTDKAGPKFVYYYLIQTTDKALLKIQCAGAYKAEPEPFKRMVTSLKRLEKAGDAKSTK
jgi:hypothetical protein